MIDYKNLRPEKKIVASELLKSNIQFESVLEVGSQWGENLVAIKDEFPDKVFVGVDTDQETLITAHQKLAMDFKFGNALKLDFPEKSFDIVFTNALFCMLQPHQVMQALQELIRVAKKEILLIELNVSEKIGYARGGRTAANWIELFKDLGFKAEKRKLTQEEWPAYPWTEYGYLITCKL
jgi:ubiquinone/menaquinone biosynthesis C-methylase UbiE